MDAEEHAWRIYVGMQDRINQMELRASFLIPTEGALLVYLAGRLGDKDSFVLKLLRGQLVPLTAYLFGLLALAIGLACLAGVLVPRAGGKGLADPRRDAISFADVHGRDWRELKRLLEGGYALDQLARQITRAGDIAWTKHGWLQGSVLSAIGGFGTIALTIVVMSLIDIFGN